MKARWLGMLILLAVMLCLNGCKDAKHGYPMDAPSISLGSIQIVMPADTLYYFPDDSIVTASGFVVVKDDGGRVMPYVKVSIELLDSLGQVEFINQQDTTDIRGRVYIRFSLLHPAGEGHTVIHAWVGSRQDGWELWVKPANELIADFNITASAPVVYPTPDAEDSVIITITVSDSAHNGIAGLVIPMHASSGRLTPISPTNVQGRAQTIWYTHGAASGDYFISIRCGNMADTVMIRVHNILPPKGERE